MKCFNCGMENENDAKYCNKCGNKIGFVPVKGNENYPWYLSTWFIIIAFICFFPLGIILFCKKHKINIIILSILFIFIVLFLYYSIKYIDSKFNFITSQNTINQTTIQDNRIDNVGQIASQSAIEIINSVDATKQEPIEKHSQIEASELQEDIETKTEITSDIEEDSGKKYLSVETEIIFSTTQNFEEDNNLHMFKENDIVYVKISSKALKKKIIGFKENIDVYYKFNCDKKFDLFLVSGEAINIKKDDYVKEYKRSIIAKKGKKQDEDVVVFGVKVYAKGSLFSLKEASLEINVEYGKNVKSIYDKNSFIYFN